MIYVGDAHSDIIASRKVGALVIAAAWSETGEPEKLIALQAGEIFYTVKDFADWLLQKIKATKQNTLNSN